MHVDFVREYCLSFPQAKESLQWGETLVFKVFGKIFATVSLDSVPPSLCCKCTPERFAELIELEGIVRAPYVGRYHWVLLEGCDVLPRPELMQLISQSYEMVLAKASKGTRRRSKPRRKRRKK